MAFEVIRFVEELTMRLRLFIWTAMPLVVSSVMVPPRVVVVPLAS